MSYLLLSGVLLQVLKCFFAQRLNVLIVHYLIYGQFLGVIKGITSHDEYSLILVLFKGGLSLCRRWFLNFSIWFSVQFTVLLVGFRILIGFLCL
jgi:hypothetical protein